ncbi:unnamed protein product [marine sediment metagenome]|uniref:Nudix hydrolase domain-containing protein n=1 Tax=marine sediment metagenome TaxID=412755 RepID=X0SKJ9_9ZZZZ
MDKFVVGFAFTEDGNSVLLIKKNRPEWQAGCLNGVGGKIEGGETPDQAMIRECLEETGLYLDWSCRGLMKGKNNDGAIFQCHIFYAHDNGIENFQQMEDEILNIYPTNLLWMREKVDNLRFLIPYGCHNDSKPFMTLTY